MEKIRGYPTFFRRRIENKGRNGMSESKRNKRRKRKPKRATYLIEELIPKETVEALAAIKQAVTSNAEIRKNRA